MPEPSLDLFIAEPLDGNKDDPKDEAEEEDEKGRYVCIASNFDCSLLCNGSSCCCGINDNDDNDDALNC